MTGRANGARPDIHRGGTIGIPCHELARYTDFYAALAGTDMPPDTKIVWAKGTSVAENCNICVKQMEGDWLWILGDDHVWHPDALRQLLFRNLDVVVPHGLRRKPPYLHVAYETFNKDEGLLYEELPRTGLVPVEATGTAGMLVRKNVLDAIEEPWFAMAGELANEDIYFCWKIRQAGFDIFMDMDVKFGHIVQSAVWPVWDKEADKWTAGLDLGEGRGITLAPPEKEEQHAERNLA